jgi:hypothetical protein
MSTMQVQDYVNMISHINLYIHNTDPEEIVRDVFNSNELTEYYIDLIDRLQNNFMNAQKCMQVNHLENLIMATSAKYQKD